MKPTPVPAGIAEASPANRWLLLVLQLPAHPSNSRVKAWRRLQHVGAIAVKNAVYALPNSAQGLEDFEWLRSEVLESGGEATVFTASSVAGLDAADMVEQFRNARTNDFKQLLGDIRRAHAKAKTARDESASLRKDLRALRDRMDHIKAIDFFAAPESGAAEAALAALDRAARPRPRLHKEPAVHPDRLDARLYRKRTWITRPRPGVDRCASAWLIRRFIDPEARFAFASTSSEVANGVPFDMYEAGFRHEGGRCTFEGLQLRFGIDDQLVRRLGEIVHDIDLKEDVFHAPQAPTIAALVEGLRASFPDDAELLHHGMALFQALYEGLAPTQPRTTRRTRRTPR